MKRLTREEARKELDEAKAYWERYTLELKALAATASDEPTRGSYERHVKLAQRVFDDAARHTPESYAEELERQARSREHFAEEQREMKEWREAVKRCKARHEPEPPHPKYNQREWKQWVHDDYHVRPFRPA